MPESTENLGSSTRRSPGVILIAATLLMAVCGLVYELLAGTLSSYLLGDSVTQFSLVIGWFLTCMGIGSWLSRFIRRHQLAWLIATEITVGVLGGHLALIGFASFTYTELYQPILLGVTGLIGILVGLEIPLVICILKNIDELKVTLANVMSADYIGALVASILFPFVLIPHLGINRAGLIAGAANVLIAGILTVIFKDHLKRHFLKLMIGAGACLLLLCGNAIYSGRAMSVMEDMLYQDAIVYAKNSRYQRIILTRWKQDVRLYLNGHLQFSSVDEYRYHEPLVHVPMQLAKQKESVLILGGGDGLATREVLKYDSVTSVTLVDLDPAVTDLFRKNPLLIELNNNALNDPRVTIVNADAMSFLQSNTHSFDVIIADLPDPSEPGLAKLYSRAFYGLAMRHLNKEGCLITQSTSPFRSRDAFWCIHNSMKSLNDKSPTYVQPLHVTIPTFGTWGFNIASHTPFPETMAPLSVACRYLTNPYIKSLFTFPADMGPLPTKINTLNEPVIVNYYRKGYNTYLE